MPFAAKDTVYPPVFMCRQAHIIHVGFFRIDIWKIDRTFPKPKIIYAIRTFGNGENDFRSNPSTRTISRYLPFHLMAPAFIQAFTPMRSRQYGLVSGIQVVTPFEWHMRCCYDRVLITCSNAAGSIRGTFSADRSISCCICNFSIVSEKLISSIVLFFIYLCNLPVCGKVFCSIRSQDGRLRHHRRSRIFRFG